MEAFESEQQVVRGHHIYKDIWTPFVGEELVCLQESSNESGLLKVSLHSVLIRPMII